MQAGSFFPDNGINVLLVIGENDMYTVSGATLLMPTAAFCGSPSWSMSSSIMECLLLHPLNFVSKESVNSNQVSQFSLFTEKDCDLVALTQVLLEVLKLQDDSVYYTGLAVKAMALLIWTYKPPAELPVQMEVALASLPTDANSSNYLKGLLEYIFQLLCQLALPSLVYEPECPENLMEDEMDTTTAMVVEVGSLLDLTNQADHQSTEGGNIGRLPLVE